jgi:hypothetical protein
MQGIHHPPLIGSGFSPKITRVTELKYPSELLFTLGSKNFMLANTTTPTTVNIRRYSSAV